MTHELKILPEYFEAVATYKKTFEIRKNDRNFKVGDKLMLKEWWPNDDQFIDPGYTGREVERWVSYILYDWQAGLKDGYCIMSLKRSAPSACTDCIKHGGDWSVTERIVIKEPSNKRLKQAIWLTEKML